ncbi:DUF707 domain-containing protein [Pedobacter fastidiosus]|uniref:DUF707 domain-containing protein n=1 Tax=Pedobacter fastidiosus TaxID=2765361 RepID=A0ABR7KVH7_9SPHI|nr:DUF707 domain-containing protein [Pedobacter fastidiosus]MBC6112114.1 hypothetical protein [Pedobacter fastidiosus]
MKSKNIVIAPCGNKSHLFKSSWLKNEEIRDFDLCLLFYHENIDNPDLYKNIDLFYHLKDFKYMMLHNLLVNVKPELLEEYDHFYFLDDDIDIDTVGINKMFELSKTFNSSISQAALSHDSFCSWPMFKRQDNCYLRYVGQIEVMAPLFSKEALVKCLPSFTGTLSSWGLDSVWSKILNYAEDKMIVFDSVEMKHTLPVGGGELYTKLGVDPYVEWREITSKYGAKLHNYIEYGRLVLHHINNDKLYSLQNFIKENFVLLKRKVNDYNILSRLKLKS